MFTNRYFILTAKITLTLGILVTLLTLVCGIVALRNQREFAAIQAQYDANITACENLGIAAELLNPGITADCIESANDWFYAEIEAYENRTGANVIVLER